MKATPDTMATLEWTKSFDRRRLCWSDSDSPPPVICSYCSGPLPAVPLMMWNKRGDAVSLCDECVHKYLQVKRGVRVLGEQDPDT